MPLPPPILRVAEASRANKSIAVHPSAVHESMADGMKEENKWRMRDELTHYKFAISVDGIGTVVELASISLYSSYAIIYVFGAAKSPSIPPIYMDIDERDTLAGGNDEVRFFSWMDVV